jgi:hypothetical protein
MIICILCTSGRESGGLLYNHPTNWFSEEPEPPEECPQCGSSLGLFTLTHDQPAAVAVAAETLLAQREEIERLCAERVALLAPVEGVDPKVVLRLDAEAHPGPWTIHERPFWIMAPDAEFGEEGRIVVADAEPTDATLIAIYRTAAPALAREVVRLRAAQQDTFKDGQIAAIERTTPIVNDIAAQRDSAERRAQALAARLAALEPVLNDMAMILGLEVVAPATPEEGQAVATKLWQYAKANEETRLTLLAELGDIRGAPSRDWSHVPGDPDLDEVGEWRNKRLRLRVWKSRTGWVWGREVQRGAFIGEKGQPGGQPARAAMIAAMIAANAAPSADAGNKPERSS